MKLSLIIALIVAGIGQNAANLVARPPSAAAKLTSLPTEELVGRFQQESEQTAGADASVTVEGFIGTDAPLRFGVMLLGVPTPKVSPVMREVVRRGLAAIPALLDHLSDVRPTKLLIAGDHGVDRVRFGGWFFNEEYDPRDFNAKQLPAGVHRVNAETEREETFAEYRIKVGDLCYVALGQIVGRRLNAVRYQPSAIVYVNSPVRTPELAAAARADWQGLTAVEFTAYLVRDLERNEDQWDNASVLTRLLFYDPPEGIAWAIKLLSHGVYNLKPVTDLTTKLWATADEWEREKLLDDFWSTHDENTRRAVEQAVATASNPLTQEDIETYPEGAVIQKHAAELAARRFPDANKAPSFSQLWLTCYWQLKVVEAVSTDHSTEIDAAVRSLFNRTLTLRAEDTEDKYSQCRLAAECAVRFVPARRARKIIRACNALSPQNPRAMGSFLRMLAAEPTLRPNPVPQ